MSLIDETTAILEAFREKHGTDKRIAIRNGKTVIVQATLEEIAEGDMAFAEAKQLQASQYAYTFRVSYPRDLWRFIKLLDDNEIRKFDIRRGPGHTDFLHAPWEIRYNHTEELGMEVWT